jgi:hypothetical protein
MGKNHRRKLEETIEETIEGNHRRKLWEETVGGNHGRKP